MSSSRPVVRFELATILLLLLVAPSCSIRRFAVNRVGDVLASGSSTFESDDDVVLVGDALPFGLKLMESLIAESPRHPGLRLAACRGFVLYSYAYVDFESQIAMEEDVERGRQMRQRARRLYLRAHDHCLAGLERYHPDLGNHLPLEPEAAVAVIGTRHPERDLPLLYWTAASLSLAISSSRSDASLLARIPEAEALVERGLELDESWDEGALHELRMALIGAEMGELDVAAIDRHYERALELSGGSRPGLFVSYAELVAVAHQDRQQFQRLLERALAFDPDLDPEHRLETAIAQRRARWLLERTDDLILDPAPRDASGGGAS